MSLKQLIEEKVQALLKEDENHKSNNTFRYHAHVEVGKKPVIWGTGTTKQKSSDNADDNMDDAKPVEHYRTSVSAHRFIDYTSTGLGGYHENKGDHLLFDHDKKTIKLKNDNLSPKDL